MKIKQNFKKRFFQGLIATIILISLVAISPFIIFPILNSIEAAKLARTVQNKELPEKTAIVEVISGVGNIAGTGNNTSLWAGMLIKTELTEEEICSFYHHNNVQKVDERNKRTSIMFLVSSDFHALENISVYDGYYIVEWTDDAVSSFFDLRGH